MNKPWQKRTRRRRNHTIRAKRRKLALANAKKDNWFPPFYEHEGKLKAIQPGSKYWKNQANRRVRRSTDTPIKGNGYRREYDYKWTIY